MYIERSTWGEEAIPRRHLGDMDEEDVAQVPEAGMVVAVAVISQPVFSFVTFVMIAGMSLLFYWECGLLVLVLWKLVNYYYF